MIINYCKACTRKLSNKCGRIYILTLFLISTILIICILYDEFISDSADISCDIQKSFEFLKISRNISDYIQPNNDTTLINVLQPIECNTEFKNLLGIINDDDDDDEDSINIIYFVMSPPENYKQRYAIRESWGSFVKPKPIFIMGIVENGYVMERAINEAKIYQDIIIESFLESYQKLIIKTAFMFKHYLRLCPMAKYLLKVDDDMFINPMVINAILKERHSANISDVPAIIGRFYDGYRPHRNSYSKWYLPYSLYSNSILPNFISGTSYLITGGIAAKQIYDMSLQVPIINLEDVYFSGLIASEALHYDLIHDKRFKDYKPLINYHCLYKDLATAHKLKPHILIQIWDDLIESNFQCHGYFYNVINFIFSIL